MNSQSWYELSVLRKCSAAHLHQKAEMIRKSIRKKDFDYSTEGYYFITICTQFKEHILGSVFENRTELSSSGRIVLSCWEGIPKTFTSVQLDSFAVMPNHIHGIIHLNESRLTPLPRIIQNFKSVSTRRINSVRRAPSVAVWQRNYFERIIRTEKELNIVRMYIKLNPLLWHRHEVLAELNLTEEKMSELLEKFTNA